MPKAQKEPLILLNFKQYQRFQRLKQAPSFNADTNSLRKAKSVCGKNLCGFFLRDFNQPPTFAVGKGRGEPKRETGIARLSFWSKRPLSNLPLNVILML